MQVEEEEHEEVPAQEQEWRMELSYTCGLLKEELQLRSWIAFANCYALAVAAFLIICAATWSYLRRSLQAQSSALVALTQCSFDSVLLLLLCHGAPQATSINRADSNSSHLSVMPEVHARDGDDDPARIISSIAVEPERSPEDHSAAVATEPPVTTDYDIIVHALHAPAAHDSTECGPHMHAANKCHVAQGVSLKPQSASESENESRSGGANAPRLFNRSLSELLARCQKLAGLDTHTCDPLEMESLATSSSCEGSMGFSPVRQHAVLPRGLRTSASAPPSPTPTADVAPDLAMETRQSSSLRGRGALRSAGASASADARGDEKCVVVDLMDMHDGDAAVRHRRRGADQGQGPVQRAWLATASCFLRPAAR